MLSAGPESRAPSQLASATAPAPPAAIAAATPQRESPRLRPILHAESLLSALSGDGWRRSSPMMRRLWLILRRSRDVARAGVTIVAPNPILGKKLIRAKTVYGACSVCLPLTSSIACCRIGRTTSRHSRAPLGLPGRFTMSVAPRAPATARLSMANGVFASVSRRIASAIPGAWRSRTASVASGVVSVGLRPVPPAVRSGRGVARRPSGAGSPRWRRGRRRRWRARRWSR